MPRSGMWNERETYRQAAERMHREIKDLTESIVEDKRRIATLTREHEVAIPMILTCPMCGFRHIDEGEFANRAHRVHACQNCGMQWAPSLRNTVGVRFLPGCKNEKEQWAPGATANRSS